MLASTGRLLAYDPTGGILKLLTGPVTGDSAESTGSHLLDLGLWTVHSSKTCLRELCDFANIQPTDTVVVLTINYAD